ncbi:MAG: hypothetical protein ACYCPP_08390 [Nitrososphaerales archaeon]
MRQASRSNLSRNDPPALEDLAVESGEGNPSRSAQISPCEVTWHKISLRPNLGAVKADLPKR